MSGAGDPYSDLIDVLEDLSKQLEAVAWRMEDALGLSPPRPELTLVCEEEDDA